MSTENGKMKRFIRIEPSPRWVRAQLGGEFVVDSKRPLLVWEHEKFPTYFFPRKDVQMDRLIEDLRTGDQSFWHLRTNERLVKRAAYHYHGQPDLEGQPGRA